MDNPDNKTMYPQLPPPHNGTETSPHTMQPPVISGYPQTSSANPIVAIQMEPYQTEPVISTAPPHTQNLANVQLITNTVEEVPNSHLCYAICTCLFCFWPVGLAAIITSVMSRSATSERNMVRARELSNITIILAHVALSLGLIIIIGNIILYVLGVHWLDIFMG